MALCSLVACALVAQTPFPNPSLGPDLAGVANLKTFLKAVPLAPEHRQMLAKQGFFVATAGMPEPQYVYGENDYQNIPSLVTTDTVLHLFHLAFDSTLRNAEQAYLSPRLKVLTAKMLRAATQLRRAQKTADGAEAARRVVAYFGVADRLLGQSTPLPADVKTDVRTELQSVASHAGFAPSSVVPNKMDFGQFVVRGHYTKSPALGRYFKAMLWYGLAPFELRDSSGNVRTQPVRMALLVADALAASKSADAWTALYEPTTLYAGTVNSLTPLDVDGVRRASGGASESQNPAQVVAALAKKDPAIYKPSILLQTGVAQGLQMRFMGQRGLLDGWVISRVTGLERPLPSGLDVFDALGSPAAKRLIDADPHTYNPRGWSEYAARRTESRTKLATLPAAEWTRNLYLGWLDVLRAKVQRLAHPVPAFMETAAWGDQSLQGALASWAQLRHDTILYGEQTAVEMGDGDEVPPEVKGFVEPNVALYERLGTLVTKLKTGLAARKLLDGGTTQNLGDFGSLLAFLRSASKKEVSGTPLTKADHLRIRHIDGEYENIAVDLMMRGQQFNTLTQDDRDMALVADVHSAVPMAFTVACGHADDLVAVVPIDGKFYLARGPVFSYYEFLVPMSDRLTDERWKGLLRDDKAPPRPAWTRSFFVKKPARPDDQ